MPIDPAPLPALVPVILCGGSGTRLWPLSRADKPKQFLPLLGAQSPFQQTVCRLARCTPIAPLIICHARHYDQARAQLDALSLPFTTPPLFVLEPVARGTAAAAVLAAHLVRTRFGDHHQLLLAPADHHIADDEAFRSIVTIAQRAAGMTAIALFGIDPTHAATEYGYIIPTSAATVAPIHRFCEKPDANTAAKLIAQEHALWNSGMFLTTPSVLIDEAERYCPPIAASCRAAAATSHTTPIIKPDHTAYEASPTQALDYAIIEHTDKGILVKATMGWSDIGSWHALHNLSDHDANGNHCHGSILVEGATNCYLYSDGPNLAIGPLDSCAVIACNDKILVTPFDRPDLMRNLAIAADPTC